MREKLIEMLEEYTEKVSARELHSSDFDEKFADYLLEHGVVVLPKKGKIYFICDKYSKYATVLSEDIEGLELFKIRNLKKYGYFLTKEEAEKALEGSKK